MIDSKISKNSLSNFYSDVKPMFLASLVTQIISFLASIFLAKLYEEKAFGYFGSFMSLSAILSIVLTLQQEKNIIVKQADKSFWYSITLLISGVLTLLFVLITIILFYFNYSVNNYLILLGIIAGLFLAINFAHENLLTAKKTFSKIAVAKVIISISTIIVQFFLFERYNNYGLIYGFTLATFIGVVYYFFQNYNSIEKIQFEKLKIVFTTKNTLITYLLPSNILNSIAVNGMPILILFCFDATSAGVFFLSMKILAAPLQLITNSISKVYFQKASDFYENNIVNLLPFTVRIVKRNLFITFISVLFLNTLGIYILEYFLNKNWESLRFFTLTLTFLMLCRSLFNPISSLVVITNRNHVSLIFNTYLVLCNVLAILIGYLNTNIIYTVIIMSFLGGFGYLCLLYYFRNLLKKAQNV